MASSGYSIGIDLGTANTRTAIFRNGDPETIPHEGEFLMPSYVAFTETSRLVGSMAKSQAGINPSNTIFSALRFIGRDYADPEVQQIIARLPFRVAETADAPVFVVTYRYEELHITPTEILAMILARARTDALRYLGPGCHITSAVITVPSSFTFQQRQAIWNAAVIARLHPSRIISTAITICSDFVLTQRSVDMGNILIVDCGAGFIDVAIATVENGVIQVKSVGGGDSLIAGDDFDSGLMIFLADQFKQVWPKAPYWHVTKDPMVITSRILRRLRTACEKAKCELSSQKQTHIEIENLLPEHSISQTITRDDMAVSCSRIFSRITRPVASALDDAQINRWAIDAVILAGGSSRIPLFQSSLCEFLSKTQVSRCLKPDEAGARGAAYISAILSRDTSMALSQQLKLLDVVPASIGIEVVGGAMYKILEKNTTLPGSKQITIITPPNQKEYSIIIYEGEDARVENNKCLGRFTLRLAPDAQGVQQIRIDVNYATSGEVHVAASEPIHGAGESRYFSALHRISEAKLKSTRIAHEDFDAAERAEESRILERHGAEGYVVFVLERLSMHQSIHASQHQRELSASAEAALAWLDENPMASSLDYHSLRCKLEEQVESMVHAFPEIGYLKRPSLPGSIELASSYVEHVPESVGESNKNPTLPARAVVSEEKEATHQNDVGSNLARMQEEIATGILEGSSLNTPIAQGVPVYAVDEQLDLTPKPPTSYIDETYHTAPANNDSAFNQEWHDDKYAQMLEDDSLSASAAMVTPQDTAQTGIHRPVTLGSAELGMQDMFSSTREIGAVFTDIDFIQISTYLYSMGRPSWSKVPRLYTVLRLADQLAILDTFINQGTLLFTTHLSILDQVL
jgi:heat shock protein 1/8